MQQNTKKHFICEENLQNKWLNLNSNCPDNTNKEEILGRVEGILVHLEEEDNNDNEINLRITGIKIYSEDT